MSVCIPCARQIAIRAGRESCVIDALAAHEWNRGGARAAREAHSAFKYDLNRTRTETGCGGRVLTVNERENDPPLSKEPCTPGPVPPFYKDRNPLLFLSLFVYISSSFSLSHLVGILVRLGWFLWHGGKDFSNFSPFPSFLYHFSSFVEFYFGIFSLEIWLGEYCNFLSLFSFSIFFFSFFLHSFGISLRFDEGTCNVFFLKVVSFIGKKRNLSILIKTFNFIYFFLLYVSWFLMPSIYQIERVIYSAN